MKLVNLIDTPKGLFASFVALLFAYRFIDKHDDFTAITEFDKFFNPEVVAARQRLNRFSSDAESVYKKLHACNLAYGLEKLPRIYMDTDKNSSQYEKARVELYQSQINFCKNAVAMYQPNTLVGYVQDIATAARVKDIQDIPQRTSKQADSLLVAGYRSLNFCKPLIIDHPSLNKPNLTDHECKSIKEGHELLNIKTYERKLEP